MIPATTKVDADELVVTLFTTEDDEDDDDDNDELWVRGQRSDKSGLAILNVRKG